MPKGYPINRAQTTLRSRFVRWPKPLAGRACSPSPMRPPCTASVRHRRYARRCKTGARGPDCDPSWPARRGVAVCVARLVESAFERRADIFTPADAGGANGGVPARGAAGSLILRATAGSDRAQTKKGACEDRKRSRFWRRRGRTRRFE